VPKVPKENFIDEFAHETTAIAMRESDALILHRQASSAA
jgi:hypothetical protein